MAEILQHQPDVVFLEEVDRFADFFEPRLRAEGYVGVFRPKRYSPCLPITGRQDGCAMFLRTARFAVEADRRVSFAAGSSQCALIIVATDRDSGERLTLACTHLKAKGGNDAIRADQARELLRVRWPHFSAGGRAPYPSLLRACLGADRASLPVPSRPAPGAARGRDVTGAQRAGLRRRRRLQR